MAEQIQTVTEEQVITKKDVRNAYIRWYNTVEVSNSYERMQTVAFCYSISGILKKLYTKKEDYIQSLKRHINFFNTQGIWGSPLLGIAIAMEEEKAKGEDIPDESIIGIKSGLMGPLAGIGDTIDWGTWKPLFFSLAAGFSAQGSISGFFICFLFAIVPFLEGYYLTNMGYSLGKQAVSKLLEGGWIKQLIMGSSILGLFMMGALSANTVKLNIPVTLMMGGTETTVQAILDSILPGMLPLALIVGIYLFFKKKGQKFGIMVFALLGLCLLGSAIGLF